MSLTNSPFWFSSGATSAGGGGNVVYPYSINQSLRFNEDDAPRLTRSIGTPTNETVWTFSCWLKRSTLNSVENADHPVVSGGTDAGNYEVVGFWNSTDDVIINSTSTGSRNTSTTQVFRDLSSWYQLVVQRNGADQIIYINGEAVNTISNASSSDSYINKSGQTMTVGCHVPTLNTVCFDGYLADVVFVDGTAVPISSLGETINGVWVAKDPSGLTFGNNGYYLKFADSGALGTDSAGNGSFSTNGVAASDVVNDSPTDNAVTMDPNNRKGATLSEGNLHFNVGVSQGVCATMPTATTGKWYFELKVNGAIGPSNPINWGFSSQEKQTFANYTSNPRDVEINTLSAYTDSSSWQVQAKESGTQTAISPPTAQRPAQNSIIGLAYDADTGKAWLAVNNVWIDSSGGTTGDPSTGANPTHTFTAGIAVFPAGFDVGGAQPQGILQADNDVLTYTPPTDFLTIKSSNLPEPAIGPQQASGQQADNYFETMLYTGNGAVQHIGSGGAQHPINVTTIDNSLRFNNSDSSFLSYQPGDNGDTQKMTYSGWIKRTNTSKYQMLLQAVDSQYDSIWIEPTNSKLQVILGSTSTAIVKTNITFIDTSKWYHICVNVDTTQATDTDRIKIWVDGDLQTLDTSGGGYPTQNAVFAAWFKSNITHRINFEGGSTYGSGYFAEVHVAEGTTYDMDNFGQYGSNGYWIPKTVSGITYGDEGFYLDFSDNSTASALGTDSSGNTNNFSATNIATTDQTGDSPTQNFNTLDPSRSGTDDLSEGNLLFTEGNGLQRQTVSTFFIPNIESSTLWYVECKPDNGYSFGIGPEATATGAGNTTSHTGFITYYSNGSLYLDTSSSAYGASYNETNLLSMVIGNGQIEFFKDNVSQGVALTGLTGDYRVVSWAAGGAGEGIAFNFGQDDSFCGYRTPSNGSQAADANGYGSFYYTPPTGSLAIVDDNIPQEGIASPDFVWIKNRSRASISNVLQDSVRGIGDNGINFNTLISDTTGAEFNQSDADGVSSLDANGFTVGYTNSNAWNNSGDTYAAWTWKAGGKANTFNIDGTGYATATAAGLGAGSLNPSGASVNTTSGFSIITWTADADNGTISHGLTSAPELIIAKPRNASGTNWYVMHTPGGVVPANQVLNLDTTGAKFTPGVAHFNSTYPTDTVFSFGGYLGTDLAPNNDKLAYLFHSVDGYSKVGSYVGNGSSDGTFVYTGFRPAFVLTKEASSTSGWNLRDNKRSPENVVNEALQADTNGTELTSGYDVDFLSNGFKLRTSLSDSNTSGQTYIYLAFAEQPFKYANAR